MRGAVGSPAAAGAGGERDPACARAADRSAGADGRLGGGVARLDPAARRPHPRRARHRRARLRGSGGPLAVRVRGLALPGDGRALGIAHLARSGERLRAARRGDGRDRLRAQLAPDLVGVAPADAGCLRRDRLQRAARGGRGALQRPLSRPDLRRQARGERPVRRPGRLHRVLGGPRPARGVGDAQHLLRGGDSADRERVRRPDRPLDRRRDHGHLGHTRRPARPRRARGQCGRRASGRERAHRRTAPRLAAFSGCGQQRRGAGRA